MLRPTFLVLHKIQCQILFFNYHNFLLTHQDLTLILTSVQQAQNTAHNFSPETLHPPAIPFTTVSIPTNINPSASFSKPNKFFDGLDRRYTRRDHSQQRRAPVILALGLHSTTLHENKN